MLRSTCLSNPLAIPYNSPLKQRIHAALLKVSTILSQTGLNIMRHRNKQTQDAINPLKVQQAGKVIPSPLDLYNNLINRNKKKPKQPLTEPVKLTRVKPAHLLPKPHRATPRERAQSYNAQISANRDKFCAQQREINAELASTLYSEPIADPPEPQSGQWDLNHLPYNLEYGTQPTGPNLLYQDVTRRDR